MVTQKRVALYARVSTMDKGQSRTQLTPANMLNDEALRSGEYIDYASGTREDRPQYQALLEAVRKRRPIVLVGAMTVLHAQPRRLQALKSASLAVDFISYQENIDTTTPQGEMIFTVMARWRAGKRPQERMESAAAKAQGSGFHARASPKTCRPALPHFISEGYRFPD